MRLLLVLAFLTPSILCFRLPRAGHSAATPGTDTDKLKLSTYSPPTGPTDFHFTPHVSKDPIDLPRDRLFGFVAGILELLALEGDFNGNLSRQTYTVQELVYPGLDFKASSETPGEFIPRRFIFWGLARMMDRFAREGKYYTSFYPMTWQGERAGTFDISWGHYSQRDELFNLTAGDAQVKEVRVPSTANDSVPNYDPRLSWDYQFYGSVLPPVDIWMSVIGAMVAAAELPNDRNLTNFAGGFTPQYKVLQAAWSAVNPPKLSRYLLTIFLVSLLRHSQSQKDYREMKVSVKDGGQLVVEGEVLHLP
ncbi:MAG: hypothetical protein Q9218_006566 [Villophora microphyllina]